ncbi:MAG: toxin-antitoxin system TumE family protein [Candidatus Helarchaeota archaeon]
MKSRDYYSQLENIIKNHPIINHFTLNFDEIDDSTGYLKGKLELIDGSILYFNEFFEIQKNTAVRLKYKYQWQNDMGDLKIRWDNVPHYPNINTFPHHKHNTNGVHPASIITLKEVLDLILDKLI